MGQIRMPAPRADVAHLTHSVRGQRVLIDSDLAFLYGVTTKRLNEAVRRNPARFPPDFAFRLTPEEVADLRSQFATSRWGGTRYAPRAFTEQGVAMLSGVLNSPTAVAVNVEIMRAVVTLRREDRKSVGWGKRVDIGG